MWLAKTHFDINSFDWKYKEGVLLKSFQELFQGKYLRGQLKSFIIFKNSPCLSSCLIKAQSLLPPYSSWCRYLVLFLPPVHFSSSSYLVFEPSSLRRQPSKNQPSLLACSQAAHQPPCLLARLDSRSVGFSQAPPSQLSPNQAKKLSAFSRHLTQVGPKEKFNNGMPQVDTRMQRQKIFLGNSFSAAKNS